MAIDPTRFSRVSIGFVDSVQSLADVDAADTAASFSVTAPAVFDDAVTITGALTQTGAVTAAGAVTVEGALVAESTTSTVGAVSMGVATAATSLGIGGGTAITAISTITGDVNLASMGQFESTSSTVAFTGVVEGDQILVSPSSEWSGDYYAVSLAAHATAADLITVSASNNSEVVIDVADVVMRFTAIKQGAFV